MQQMTSFNELHEKSRMAWIEPEQGWAAAPEEVLGALASDGFEECKSATTTSRSDRQPAGGLWQGVDPRTGSVASAIWMHRVAGRPTLVFVEVDGVELRGDPGRLAGHHGGSRADPYQDEGGEG